MTLPTQPTPTQPISDKKKMGAFGKTVIGALIGLPVGLVAGMKYFYLFFVYL